MARIAFFSIYAFGHTNPTLAVVRELTRRGHRVRYYSFSPFQKAIEAAGGECVLCDAYLPPPPPDVDRQVGRDFAGLVEMITDTTLAMDGPIGRDLREFAPHCVVSDSLCFWGKLWSAKLGLPYVCSTTTFAFNRETAGMMKQTPGQLLRLLMGRGRIRRCMERLREGGYPVKGLLDLIQNSNDTDTIVYTSRAFQPKADTFSSKYAFIGPSIPEQIGAGEAEWKGCCYISLGTVNNRNLPFYQACIEALRQENFPVVISVGEQTGLSAFRDVPEHIFLRPRVDQLAVLARASVFVTHCGMNSASEGLYFGVPLVLYPQQAEQGLVARRVEELGAGLRLRRASPEAIRAAVRQVREQQSYRSRAREIAAGFRDAGGYRRGADKILEAAARGRGTCAEHTPML